MITCKSPLSAEEFRERKFSMVTLRKHTSEYRAADRRASLHNQSKLQSLKDALLQPSKKLMSPPPEGSKVREKTTYIYTTHVPTTSTQLNKAFWLVNNLLSG